MTAATRTPRPAPRRGGITRSVLRGAGIILVVTIFARIAGFVRYLVFGASVGAGDVGTAYTTANLLPNVLFEVAVGGMLAAVVVPLIAGLVPEGEAGDRHGDGTSARLAAGDTARIRAGAHGADLAPTSTLPAAAEAEGDPGAAAPSGADEELTGSALADRIVSTLLTWTVLGTGLLAVAVMLFSAPIAQLLLSAQGTGTAGTAAASSSAAALGTGLLRIFALQLPLYGLSVVMAAYLQARKRFLWPALMPLLSSVTVMISYRLYAHLVPPVATAATIGDGAVAWLGWGTTAGVAVMAVPVAVAALRAGLRIRPSLTMPHHIARRALALGGAGLGAVGAQQLVMALVMLLAMRAGGVGTLPVFQYAQALYLLPYAVLVVPLVTSVFPHLSELRLVGDRLGFARLAATSVRTVMVVSVIGAAMLLAAGPALEQFFHLIDRAGATGVGSTTAGLALGLVGFAVSTQCTRVLSAALRAKDALLVGSVGWLIAAVIVVVVVLPSPSRSAAEASTAFGIAIALGMAVAGLVGLARIADTIDHGGHLRPVRRTAVVAPLALLGGGVPGLLLSRQLITAASSETVAVLIGILSGVTAAVLAATIMALADRETTLRILRTRRSGRRGAAETQD